MDKEKDGVWRTIRGRRIFIGKGESLGEAMSKSGKFNRSDIRETKAGLSQKDKFDRTNSQSLKQRQKAIKDFRKKDTRYSNSVYTTDRQDEKNRTNENAHIEGSGQTRVQRNWNKYSEEDRREHRHELIQKKLADYNFAKAHEDLEKNSKEWENRFNQGYNKYDDLDKERKDARNRFETARIKGNIDTQEKSDKIIADFKAKKQSNNKIESNFYKKLNKDDKKKYDDYIKKGYSQSDIENTLMYKTQDERMREAGIEFASSELNKQSNNKIDNEYYGSKKAQLDLEMSKYTSKEKLERAKEKLQNSNLDKEERQYYQDYIEKREGTPIKDILKQSNNKQETIKNYVEKKQSNNKVATEIKDGKAIRNENAPITKYNDYNKNEEKYRENLSREIAKELNASMKYASENKLEKEAGSIRSYVDGEVLSKGEKPYTNIYGGLERSTKSLENWLKRLRKGK